MCRIAGMINRSQSIEFIQDQVSKMCQLQWRGGPDDGGIFSEEKSRLVLGNRRLSIMDLSPEGHMPMHYAGKYTITYNGEIYNFLELKSILSDLGYTFHSNSDTEVVLAAFAEWNVDAFAKLNGMFAFALLDHEKNYLYLVRDQVGIKPLYYYLTDHQLSFASEIGAFANFNLEKNTDTSVFLLAYGHMPGQSTPYKNLQSFPQGHYLCYDLSDGKYQHHRYASFNYESTINTKQAAITKTRQALQDSVHRQLISDAPIGVFLSGGLDSSILAKLSADELGNQLHTLSIYFEDDQFSEKRFQDDLVVKLNSKHAPLLLTKNMFDACLPLILDDMDMPSCDGLNTWFISRHAAQQGLKAVLSGLGGDELFGGYPSFHRMKWANKLQIFPDALIGLSRFSQSTAVRRSVYLKIPGLQGKYLFLRGHYIPSEIADLLDMSEKQVWEVLCKLSEDKTDSKLDSRNQASWMEFNGYMHNQLLRDSDAMSMKHGLEIRVPFLDHTVIRTAFSIDPNIKFPGKYPKQLLIDAFENELPSSIWNRPKMGFTFPFVHWLKDAQYVQDIFRNAPPSFQDRWKEFQEGKLHWSKIMTLLLLKKRNILS
jgi:asparagine synthase (glutamine-hydrolysing)